MPARLPTPEDFPPGVTVSIAPPPPQHSNANILILLHGIGGAAAPFAQLGRQLNLPHTATMALQGPAPLPFDLGGYHWGDDIVFDEAGGNMDPDAGFQKASRLLEDQIVRKVLLEKCGYKLREIIFYGFGQGGAAALVAASQLGEHEEFAGIIAIGSPLPAEARAPSNGKKFRTPVLALGGSSKSLLTTSAVQNLKQAFDATSIHRWQRQGDSMPANRDEMLPIMQFFARRLRAPAPAGSVDVGG